jgi:putative flippase GtrA
MGFVLQAAMLSVLVRWACLGTAAAVTIAVLTAVSHNFFWHEYFTWPGLPREDRWRRWVTFHVSTGIMSVVSNVAVTMTVAGVTGLPLVAANAVAVALVSIANFWVSERVIFSRSA